MSKGMKNIYLCQDCGRGHVSQDIDNGVTPFMTACLTCNGTAVSMLYRAPQELLAEIPAAQEWYRPKATELGALSPHTLAHVEKGGLISRTRSLPANPSWPRAKGGVK